MGEHEIEASVAVPAVPYGQTVEADGTLDERDAREQQHLQECRVRTQEPGEPCHARQQLARAVDVCAISAVSPEPDDQKRIARHEASGQPAAMWPVARRSTNV